MNVIIEQRSKSQLLSCAASVPINSSAAKCENKEIVQTVSNPDLVYVRRSLGKAERLGY